MLNSYTPEQIQEIKKLAQLEMAKRVYLNYVQLVHNGKWLPSKHLTYLTKEVETFITTNTSYSILALSLPPQHGKSQSITETLPSYYLGKYPNKRVILVSYNSELATRFARRNISKIEEYGKQLFNIELSKKSADTFEIKNNTGSCISRGILSGLTGNPGDLIIIDDPIKNREEADSPTHRNKIWDEYLNSIKTRLSATGKIIIIQTRWHLDDLAGRILQHEKDKVKYINLPCECTDPSTDPLERSLGDALFPEIGKDNEWLQDFKLSYTTKEGSRTWRALYQGQPVGDEGNIIKRNWWKYYTTLPEMMQIIMSVDASFKDDPTSDFTCVQVWGKRESNMYLIDLVNERMDFPTTLGTIMTLKHKYPKLGLILVEDKANGSAIIQMLRRTIPGVVAVNPRGGKIARVNAVSPAIESGNVYLPTNAKFTIDFVNQCTEFPNSKNDDMVDSMSQALNRFIFFTAELPSTPTKDDFGIHNEENDKNYLEVEYTTEYLNY